MPSRTKRFCLIAPFEGNLEARHPRDVEWHLRRLLGAAAKHLATTRGRPAFPCGSTRCVRHSVARTLCARICGRCGLLRGDRSLALLEELNILGDLLFDSREELVRRNLPL